MIMYDFLSVHTYVASFIDKRLRQVLFAYQLNLIAWQYPGLVYYLNYNYKIMHASRDLHVTAQASVVP